ncbi:MAG: glutamate--tRNA ligase family protein [Vicinamibacterales bacterium]
MPDHATPPPMTTPAFRTRFAPAPTGYLHLGHVVNAIHVWGLAGREGGEVLLRIEDHDAERCRAKYETALLDDLDWLGFVPDRYPTDAFRAGRCESRQRDRSAVYEAAMTALAGEGLVYACTCSRQDLARAQATAAETGTERPYPGTCRERGLPLDTPGAGWRLRMAPGTVAFEDRWCGPQWQEPAAQCGDLLIRDRLGNWTYQFVASVDDWRQGITHVVRGRDLLASTGRQIRIAARLGRTTPATFAHHDLLMRTPTRKLSKSDGATGVRDLRGAGWTAARVIGEAARRAGLIAAARDVGARDAAALVPMR